MGGHSREPAGRSEGGEVTVCARSSREAEQGPAEGWELMCRTWGEAKGSWMEGREA